MDSRFLWADADGFLGSLVIQQEDLAGLTLQTMPGWDGHDEDEDWEDDEDEDWDDDDDEDWEDEEEEDEEDDDWADDDDEDWDA
jgi:hypothetical protein